MKRIGIIGSINRDTVTDPDGNVTRGLGGVLYTGLGLASLGGDGVEGWLVGRLGEDTAPQVKKILSDWPGVRIEGMPIVSAENYHSRIQYFADGSKRELLTGSMEPLCWDDLEPFLKKWDGLLINFITGFEIEFPTLVRVRENFQRPLVMDVHSLTLGRRELEETGRLARMAAAGRCRSDERSGSRTPRRFFRWRQGGATGVCTLPTRPGTPFGRSYFGQ